MVRFSRSPFFKLRSDNSISVTLPTEVRETLVHLADELRQSIETDSDDVRRLFPTAYPDDASRDAGYQVFSRSELIDGRHERIDVLEQTAHATTVSISQLGAWLKVVNDLRLILGTRLDISEETSLMNFDASQYDKPEAALHQLALYEALGELLVHIVDALTGTLPPDEE